MAIGMNALGMLLSPRIFIYSMMGYSFVYAGYMFNHANFIKSGKTLPFQIKYK